MTQHDEFKSALASYALDALDDVERERLRVHLSTCDRCRAELAELRRVNAALGLAVEPVAPPEGLRARTLALATAQRRDVQDIPRVEPTATQSRIRAKVPAATRGWAPAWWLAAAAALVAMVSGGYAWSLRGQVRDLRAALDDVSARAATLASQLDAVRRDSASLVRTVSVLSAPDLRRANLSGQGAAAAATGRAFWSPSRGLVFTADSLPALDPGRAYQLWLVTSAAPLQAVSAGLLPIDASGSTTLIADLPTRVPAVAVAVSVEPASGSAAPTTPPILIGPASNQ
jgi:hypothetical protein